MEDKVPKGYGKDGKTFVHWHCLWDIYSQVQVTFTTSGGN